MLHGGRRPSSRSALRRSQEASNSAKLIRWGLGSTERWTPIRATRTALRSSGSHAQGRTTATVALRASAKPRRVEAREANPLGVYRTLDADLSDTHVDRSTHGSMSHHAARLQLQPPLRLVRPSAVLAFRQKASRSSPLRSFALARSATVIRENPRLQSAAQFPTTTGCTHAIRPLLSSTRART